MGFEISPAFCNFGHINLTSESPHRCTGDDASYVDVWFRDSPHMRKICVLRK